MHKLCSTSERVITSMICRFTIAKLSLFAYVMNRISFTIIINGHVNGGRIAFRQNTGIGSRPRHTGGIGSFRVTRDTAPFASQTTDSRQRTQLRVSHVHFDVRTVSISRVAGTRKLGVGMKRLLVADRRTAPPATNCPADKPLAPCGSGCGRVRARAAARLIAVDDRTDGCRQPNHLHADVEKSRQSNASRSTGNLLIRGKPGHRNYCQHQPPGPGTLTPPPLDQGSRWTLYSIMSLMWCHVNAGGLPVARRATSAHRSSQQIRRRLKCATFPTHFCKQPTDVRNYQCRLPDRHNGNRGRRRAAYHE